MKRSRYTALLDNGDRRVILAYTAQQVADHYGVPLSRVSRGDYRKAAKSPTGAKHVPAAVAEACAILGISFPVEIRYSSKTGVTGDCYGNHIARPKGPGITVKNGKVWGLAGKTNAEAGWTHCIMVKTYLTATQMGETLWHELTHAMQFERYAAANPDHSARATLMAWKAAYHDGSNYSLKAAELEARSNEPRNADLPLAR